MAPPELIPQSVSLRVVPGLTPLQGERLEGIWVNSAQELIALAQTPKPAQELVAALLGVDQPGLQSIVQAAIAVVPRTRAGRGDPMEIEAMTAVHGLGALLDEPQGKIERRRALPQYPKAGGRAVLPSSVSLLDQLPPLRNQGSRGSCVAFAALAVREQLEIAAGAPSSLDLSEQFVYWWCKEKDGVPSLTGTYVSVGMRCLREMGAPLEETWPYVSVELGSPGQGPPPPAAALGNPVYRALRIMEFSRIDTEGMKTCLAQGRAVAFSIPVFGSWYYSLATRRWGKITLPLPGEAQDGGHALTLVGYQDEAAAPGGGYFLVRNSWQPWSYDGVWRQGYGYIPYGYINRYASALFSAERVADGRIALRDALDDPGTRPLVHYQWNSPDIWLRREADGGLEHQLPVQGSSPVLYVRVRNEGTANAYAVEGELLAAQLAPHVPDGAWHPVGRG